MFASFKEGFNDTFEFRQSMDNVFNNILPNFVGTTSEGARIVRENPNVALRLDAAIADNIGGQSGKVVIPQANTIFQSIEASPHLQNLNEICKTSTVDELISTTNPADKYRCGWIYQRDPTGIAPKISTGYLGSRSGPLQLFGQSPAGQWFWDLDAAKRQMLLDKCSHVATCEHLGSPLLGGDCGFCTGASKKSIVIGRDGKPLYPTMIGQSCPADKIVTSRDQCPPPPPPAPPRRDPEGNIIPEPQTPMTVCRQLPNGKIGRDCLVQQLKLGGCSDTGSLAQALRNSRDPRDVLATIRPNQAFMVYQERSPAKLKDDIMMDGSIAAEAALADFTSLYTEAQGAQPTGLRAAAQDLCLRAGTIEEFDFCSEIQDSATPPFGLDCMQKEFKRAGGLPAGDKYPTTRNMADFSIYPTWGTYKEFVRDLARRTQSTDPEIQAFALKDFMGINRETLGKPKLPFINAYELFAFRWHSNDDALFMGRMFQSGVAGMPIITDSSKIPALSGTLDSSFVLISDLRPPGSADIQLSFPVGMGNGASATINADRENMWERNKNAPNDYRRDFLHQQNNANNESCTQLKAGGKNYLKAYFNQKVSGPPAAFRLLYRLCNQGGNPMTIPANWVGLSQEFKAPMLSFEVRSRGIRGRQAVMGLHEYRMPEFFIADNSNVYVEDRDTNSGPNGLKSITFESTNSKWEINKLMHCDAWQSLTFCFKLNRPNKTASEAIMAWRIAALGIRSLNDGNVVFDIPEANQRFRAQIGKWYVVNITKTSSGGYLNNDITIAMYEYNMARSGVSLTEPANVFKKVYMRNNPLSPGPPFGIMSWGADSAGPVSAGFSMAWVRLYDYALDAENFSKDINNKWMREWSSP
jgi:hypothetical protein